MSKAIIYHSRYDNRHAEIKAADDGFVTYDCYRFTADDRELVASNVRRRTEVFERFYSVAA